MQIEKDNVAYTEAKQKFFNLKFETGDITVKPLTHVKEFYEEAEVLHHCVSGYYSKENSLILSAKVNGENAETVEVSLSDFTVAQARGLQNQETDHHKEIVSLVESNMKQIKRASKTK